MAKWNLLHQNVYYVIIFIDKEANIKLYSEVLLMKKNAAFLACIILLLILSLPAYSESMTRLFYDGKWYDYKIAPITLKLNGETLQSDMPPILFNNSTLVPARAVFEKLGAKVSWDGSRARVFVTMDNTDIVLTINDTDAVVNGNTYRMPVPPKIINNRTMIPVRFVSEALGLDVEWKAAERIVKIDRKNARIMAITSGINGSNLRITVSSDSIIGDYSTSELSDNPRVVVDIKNAVLKIQESEQKIDSSYVSGVRASQFSTNPDITRVVADLKEWTDYSVTLSQDKKQLYIDFNNGPAAVNSISLVKSDSFERLDIGMKFARTPVISSTDSDGNITIDIQKAYVGQVEKNIPADARFVKTVDCLMPDPKTVRLVIGTKEKGLLKIEGGNDGIKLYFSPRNSKDMRYSASQYPRFVLKNENIGENYFNYRYKTEGYGLVLSLPSTAVGVSQGRLIIYDGCIDYIDFIKNCATKRTDIVITTRNRYDYRINTIDKSDEIVVDALPARADAGKTNRGNERAVGPGIRDKVVVIDPGHGGSESGAIYPSGASVSKSVQVREKDLNLDISRRLYALLKDSGISAQMTRQDDRYVDLYDRGDFANRVNASLFVSVHNNYDDNLDDGTMTLFNPAVYDAVYGISGERLAQITQEELVEKLGTTDRGIWKRPRLAVLNCTHMPAVIAEVAYISNESDRQKLLNESFRQKAAEALFIAIIRALNEIADSSFQ